ncbi:MAG TPA: 6-pyruvoyl-tetrahydropterin synthase-related protein, partial [Anaerolineae bacterium]
MTPRSLAAGQVRTGALGQSRWRAIAAALAGRPWLLLPFLALPAIWPFLRSGLPRGQDTIMHLMRLGLLDDYVRHGTLFPRWFPELMLGRGYPVFNFYAPLTYYVAEALRLIELNFADALIGTYLLLILAAGVGTYLLARDLFGADRPAAALVAATAYMYAPYLLTNVFVRGALAETGAQAFLPWIFWSLRRLLRSDRPGRYLLPAALSLAGLALTHNVTLLFVPPAYLAYLV